MMRRGPLADSPIETLLADAAAERINGVIELHGPSEGLVYFVEGDVYLADMAGQPRIDERLMGAGLLTAEQIARHTEPGDDTPYLALALDTDPSIDDHGISDWLLDLTATTIAAFIGVDSGEYELDPYGSHPAGILASWPSRQVLDRVEALHAEAERLAEIERAQAERIEAERIEAERLEAERLEAELREEAERLEAEQHLEAERLREHAQTDTDLADETGATQARLQSGDPSDAEGGVGDESAVADPTSVVDGNVEDHDPIALPPPPAAVESTVTPSLAASHVLIVAADAAPDGTEIVELTALEWRVVVPAARGISLADLCRHLDLEEDTVGETVAALCERGLLATVG